MALLTRALLRITALRPSTLFRLVCSLRNWPLFARNTTLCPKRFRTDGIYILHGGNRIYSRADVNDAAALFDIWIEYQYSFTHAHLPFCWEQCSTILDIGAHIGAFTVWAASKAPKAHIISCEPHPENYAMLSRNIALNHLGNRVEVLNTAVGSASGSTQLFEHGAGSACYSTVQHHRSQETLLQTPVTTVQALLQKQAYYDLVKLDCEGAEHDILHAMPSEVFQNIGAFVLETHAVAGKEDGDQKMVSLLQNEGFSVRRESFAFVSSLRKSHGDTADIPLRSAMIFAVREHRY